MAFIGQSRASAKLSMDTSDAIARDAVMRERQAKLEEKRKQEEEIAEADQEQKAAQAEAAEIKKQRIASGELNPDGSERNALQHLGSFVTSLPKNIVGLGKGIVDETSKLVNTVRDAGGTAIAEAAGVNDKTRQSLRDMEERNLQTAEQARKNAADKSRPEEERQYWKQQAESYSRKMQESGEELSKFNKEQESAVDPRKVIPAITELGLDAITLGGAGKALKGVRAMGQGTKAMGVANKVVNPEGFKQMVGSGMALGAGFGGLSKTREQAEEGKDFNAGEVAESATMGALFGGALGGGFDILGKGFRKGVQKLKGAKNSAETAQAEKAILEANNPNAPGAKDSVLQLEAGFKKPETIEKELQALRNGEYPDDLFKFRNAEGEDVSSLLAGTKEKIAARENSIRNLQNTLDNYSPSDRKQFGVQMESTINKFSKEVEDLKLKEQTAFTDAGQSVTKELDKDAVVARYNQLEKELAQSKEYHRNVAKTAERTKGEGIDLKALDIEEANLKNGIIPQNLTKDFKAAENTHDVNKMMRTVDPEDSRGFIRGSEEIDATRKALNEEMSGLYTSEKLAKSTEDMTTGYNKAIQDMEGLPPPLKEQRTAELNESLMKQQDELRGMVERDAPRVTEINRELANQDLLEKELVKDVRDIQLSDPNLFRPADKEKIANRLQEINDERFLAQKYQDPTNAAKMVEQTVGSGKNLAREVETNPAVAKAVNETSSANLSVLENTGKSPGVGGLLGIPVSVMKKFGRAGAVMSEKIEHATETAAKLNGEFQHLMEQWGTTVKKSGANTENVAKALDGNKASLANLTDGERQVYSGIKEWFEKRAGELGLPSEARISEYLPHIFENKNPESIEKSLLYIKTGKKDGVKLTEDELKKYSQELAGVSPETLRYLEQHNSFKSKNGHLIKRNGAKDFSMDLEKILTVYNDASVRTIAYNPLADEYSKMGGLFTKEQAKYLDEVFSAMLGRKESAIDNAIDGMLQNASLKTGLNLGGKGSYAKMSRDIRSYIYNGTIGGNVGSIIRNMQQQVNNYTELGATYLIKGSAPALRSIQKNTLERKELLEMGVISSMQRKYFTGNKTGQSLKNSYMETLWRGFTASEELCRANAYFGGKDKWLKKNPGDITGAKEYGMKLANKTNFTFDAAHTSKILHSETAKNGLQMQTYNLQQANYIKNMFADANVFSKQGRENMFVKQPNGKYKMNLEHQTKVMRFMAGNVAFFGTVGAATGMDWKEAIPFADNVTEGEAPRSPITQTIFGDGKGQPGIIGAIGSGAKAAMSGDWSQAGKDADALAKSGFKMFVPGGNQMIKTTEGLASAQSGVSTTGNGLVGGTLDKVTSTLNGSNPGGSIRFNQGQDSWSKFKAGVLGQYATQEGRDWISQGMKRVPSNLKIDGQDGNDYIKGLPREKQEQYVGYYQNKTRTVEQLKESVGDKNTIRKNIVEGLKNRSLSIGDAVKAANEYNDLVTKSMSGYLSGNDKIPKRIHDDFEKSMLIDVKSMANASRRTQSSKARAKAYRYRVEDQEEY